MTNRLLNQRRRGQAELIATQLNHHTRLSPSDRLAPKINEIKPDPAHW
jgi:hypothetical protein